MNLETVPVAVVGSVSCGPLTFAEENIEEYIKLPTSLLGHGKFFILRASGQSMIGAGIEDGDLVVVRQQETAEPGQIVVALVEDEVTLKRFFPDPQNGCIRLHPENRRMKDIIVCEGQYQDRGAGRQLRTAGQPLLELHKTSRWMEFCRYLCR